MKYLSLLMVITIMSLLLTGCGNQLKGGGNLDSDVKNTKMNIESESGALAQCLTEKGATMYGTEWCSHCKNQKALFGKSFQYVDYIDCDKNKAECQKAGIRGYPTWNINGQNYPGGQSLEKLSILSGCGLN